MSKKPTSEKPPTNEWAVFDKPVEGRSRSVDELTIFDKPINFNVRYNEPPVNLPSWKRKTGQDLELSTSSIEYRVVLD